MKVSQYREGQLSILRGSQNRLITELTLQHAVGSKAVLSDTVHSVRHWIMMHAQSVSISQLSFAKDLLMAGT